MAPSGAFQGEKRVSLNHFLELPKFGKDAAQQYANCTPFPLISSYREGDTIHTKSYLRED
jgi:hypothetical protein